MLPANFETMLHLTFKIIRLIGNRLEASFCDLDLDISINNKNSKNTAPIRMKAIKMWIESFVDGCVCYDATTDIDIGMLSEVSNHIMMCHDEPHDHILLQLLHTKLSTIGGDEIIITASSLSSDTGEGFSCRVSGSIGECLPSMKEWIGDKNYHQSPWWYRDDSSTIDLIPGDDADLGDIPVLGEDMFSIIQSMDVSALKDDSNTKNAETSEIIKPVFKPRIIENEDD